MYLDLAESQKLAEAVAALTVPASITGVLFPSTLALTSVQEKIKNTGWGIGAQNVAWAPKGAYTGAVSAELFQAAGVRYALIGHSERRHIFGETDTAVAKKIAACVAVGIAPVLCIGETAEDAAADKRQYRLRQQVTAALDGGPIPTKLIIAYEPVWAISPGTPCTPADADDVAGWLKLWLTENWGTAGTAVPILYGGSVDPDNISAFIHSESLDGVLVGSQSTQASSFKAMLAQLS